MSDGHVHDMFEAEAADRDLPSPYMEKYFAKLEGRISIDAVRIHLGTGFISLNSLRRSFTIILIISYYIWLMAMSNSKSLDSKSYVSAVEIKKAEERIFACRMSIMGQILIIALYFVAGFQLLCLYNFLNNGQWIYKM